MPSIPGHAELRKIVVLNPKGGSGKTTLAVNLVGYLLSTGRPAALVDFDPQGSAIRWVRRRSAERPPVHGIAVFEKPATVTRSFHLRVPHEIRHVVIDTPAALPREGLAEYASGAHAILVPVLPSAIDIEAASRLVADLLLVARLSRRMGRLGIIANRVRDNTLGYRRLMAFLQRLSIPIVGALRDSQGYLHAAEQGMGIHEMRPSAVRKDLASWLPMTSWLENRMQLDLTPRDLLRRPVTIPSGRPARVIEFPGERTG